jgi:hypothetical protein
VVTNLAGGGAGSLPQAITDANANAGPDTISFQKGLTGTIFMGSEQPTIKDTTGLTTIDGVGADITISGNKLVRVFEVGTGAKLTLSNLTVADGGRFQLGGGILNNGGTLEVNNSTLSGNSADIGGGIAHQDGTATITNSTFSGNSGGTRGGGITSLGAATPPTTITIRNTILASTTCVIQGATFTDEGGNLDDGATCPFTASTSKSNTPAGLDPDPFGLRDNGGPTQTIALCSGVDTPKGCTGPSAAIDAAVNCPPPTTDQRGVSRPQGASCDIGAFELQRLYAFSGFFSPVDNPPANNEVKAGRAIPVKFSLGGDQGLDIFESGYPKSVQMPCESTGSVDAIEQTLSDKASHLTYDATTDTYTYVWKTDKEWANTCRQLVVKLNDGSTEHVANFKFVK